MPKKEHIRQMFDSIASDYDRLNHLMSLHIDKTWRKKALQAIFPVDDRTNLHILDLACGTGDFAIAMARKIRRDGLGGHVTGVDLSEGMLNVMQEKIAREDLLSLVTVRQGDGENLPLGSGVFDRVTIAFGIRNFEDREKGLKEMLRVLRPGGSVVILELSVPENGFIRWCYNLYFLHILPLIGGSVSGDKAAYEYLPESVIHFPKHKAFLETMRAAGFTRVRHKAFTFGICRMFTGVKA